MDRMLVVVFDDETGAYRGWTALSEMHTKSTITCYAGAVIAKDADGAVSIKQAADEGPLGTAVGLTVGALIGLIGGPAGLAIGAATGGLIGSVRDLSYAGVDADFAAEVAEKLTAGKCAVVAEVTEYWMTPVDTKMDELGGTVFRRTRDEVVDEQIQREVDATNAEWNQLKTEYNEAVDDAKAKVKKRADAAHAKLEKATQKARDRAAAIEKEAEAKIQALQDQMARATGEAKEAASRRADQIRTDYKARAEKLKAASKLTAEALTP